MKRKKRWVATDRARRNSSGFNPLVWCDYSDHYTPRSELVMTGCRRCYLASYLRSNDPKNQLK